MSAKTVRYDIDLEDLFGEFPDDESLRQKIGQRAIDMIRERTQEGTDKNGQAFKAYSESYINSLGFKAAGKSASEVNMTMFGDMLGTLDIVEQDSSRISLGWDDETQNAKAYGHISGYEGHPTIKAGPKRDFFGLTKAQVKSLTDEFRDEVSAATRERDTDEPQASQEDQDTLGIISLIERFQDEL